MPLKITGPCCGPLPGLLLPCFVALTSLRENGMSEGCLPLSSSVDTVDVGMVCALGIPVSGGCVLTLPYFLALQPFAGLWLGAQGVSLLTVACFTADLSQSVSGLSPAPITSSVSDLSPAPITSSGHLVPDTPRNNYVMAFPIVLTQGDPCLAGQKWNDSLTCVVAEVAGKTIFSRLDTPGPCWAVISAPAKSIPAHKQKIQGFVVCFEAGCL